MMDHRQAWELFMQTGRIDAYMMYKRLERNVEAEEPEGEGPFDADQDGWNRPARGTDLRG